MRLHRLAATAALLGALVLTGAALAQTVAYTAPGSSNMRAGPGTEYPVVARILGGSAVKVHGCLSNHSWCDAAAAGARGWIATRRLEVVYGGSRLPLPQYYARFRVPLVNFDFGYWDRHYRDRDFYRGRRRKGGRGGGVYIDPDQSRDGRGTDPGHVRGRVLGKVTDRPGFCYIRNSRGATVVARCP